MLAFIRRIQAKKHGVPFIQKTWYNYRAMISKDSLVDKSYIEIFDKAKPEYSQYISCPNKGGTVVYNDQGRRYLYKIIGFDNSNPNSDWLYSSDYINPIIEFIRPLKEGEFPNLS